MLRRAPKETATAPVEPAGPGKNRPTPKRSAAEAANRRPLVPADRKGAASASRDAVRSSRQAAMAGRMAGDDRYLAPRERGPVKRYARDLVDGRRNAGEFFLPFVLVLVVVQLTLTRVPSVLAASYGLLYAGLLVVVFDCFRIRSLVRRGVTERFGAEALEKGVVSGAVMRSLQLRRSRIPRALVARGEPPR